MKNNQKGFIIPIIIIIVAAVAVGGGIYAYNKSHNISETSIDTTADSTTDVSHNQSSSTPASTTIGANVDIKTSISVSGNTLSVMSNGKVTQTISLDEHAIGTLVKEVVPEAHVSAFITNQDVNFDGHTDIAVFTETAYSGVNNYYDYYIFNSKTGVYDKSSVLVDISNPTIDVSKKQIISNYRSGPQWYKDTFQFNGSAFVKVGNRVSN